MVLLNLIKDVLDPLTSIATAVFNTIWGGLSAVLGFFLGSILSWLYYGYLLIINICKKRIRLSNCVKGVLQMSSYYPGVDLDSVGIILNAKGIPGFAKALTEGHNIFWKNATFTEDSEYDLKILLHELVHVRQYEKYGKEVFYIIYSYEYINEMFSYSDIPLEKEARDFVVQIYDNFILDYKKNCNPSLQIQSDEEPSD